jgi:hypothetical protein
VASYLAGERQLAEILETTSRAISAASFASFAAVSRGMSGGAVDTSLWEQLACSMPVAIRGSFETRQGLAHALHAQVSSKLYSRNFSCGPKCINPCRRIRDDAANGKFRCWFLAGAEAIRGVAASWLQVIFENSSSAGASSGHGVLALEDKKEEDAVSPAAEVHQESGDVGPTGKGAVAATLAALHADVQPEGKSSKSAKKSGMRKPASVSKVSKKRPAAYLRRPAAAAVPKAEEGESRDARRERLIKERVPKEMQHKYRGGCSKCYYRKGCTLSCWTYRGYNMKE